MKREGSSPLGLYTIGIAALFLAGFFLLVVFGAGSYRNTVAGQNDNMDSRALLSYLATTVKGHDSAGAVSVLEGAEGSILVLAEGDTGYALRIYRSGGILVEDYAPLESLLRPGEAQSIGATNIFTVEREGSDLLRLTTDAGQILLRLRSGGAE